VTVRVFGKREGCYDGRMLAMVYGAASTGNVDGRCRILTFSFPSPQSSEVIRQGLALFDPEGETARYHDTRGCFVKMRG